MFAGNTRALPHIRSFAEADDYWHKTKKPPRSKKWEEWQRPLKDTSSHHYRIQTVRDQQNNLIAYDLILYHTVMARYFKPDPIGRELRQYMGHDSQTSKGFMWDVLGVSYFSKRHTTDGRMVYMPVPTVPMHGMEFSCQAWFTADGKLDVAASSHTPLFKRVSHDDDKHMRKIIKAKFEPLLTLCGMRVAEFETTEQADYMRAGAFSTRGLRHSHTNAIYRIVRAFELGTEPEAKDIEWFIESARACYVKLVSDRADAQKLISWHNPNCSPLSIAERVTEKDLIRSLWASVLKHGGLKQQNGRIEYPQFPEPDQVVLSNVFAQRI